MAEQHLIFEIKVSEHELGYTTDITLHGNYQKIVMKAANATKQEIIKALNDMCKLGMTIIDNNCDKG